MKNPLFPLSLLFLIMLFSVSSFAEDTNIRILEKTELMGSRASWNLFVHRMCVGGYEFVYVCEYEKDECKFWGASDYTLTQIITESGGGKKC